MIGQRVGSYTIVEKLGEGGMGVVYRATDSRLHRDVALKFIPEALASDAQTMGRFEREAQVLASLNHPNIASIYGLEESEGRRALVMELAPGEELATRIARGKIPLEEALRIALSIAEALEAAHDRGIIHRDLKPANIKLGDPGESGGGRIKILDFGLAKALQSDAGASSTSIDLTHSPTIAVAATHAGMILGTASYMSPEQARAVPADRRADIWSFGTILYEMLAGRRAFLGETVAETLAKLLEREPDWSLLPATTPPADQDAARALPGQEPTPAAAGHRRCAARSRGDAPEPGAAAIEGGRAGGGADRDPARRDRAHAAGWGSRCGRSSPPARWYGRSSPRCAADRARPRCRRRRCASRSRSATRSSTSLAAPSWRFRPTAGGSRTWQGADSEHPLHARSRPARAGSARLRRDHRGRSLPPVLLAGRELGRLRHPLRAAQGEGGRGDAGQDLRRVAQPRRHLAAGRHHRDRSHLRGGLARVPAAGGELTPVTELDASCRECSHRWPQALPGGKQVLFTNGVGESYDQASLEVVSLETGERKVVYQGGSYGRYAPSGHLVFENDRTLFAVRFDLDRLEVEGAPASVVENLAISPPEGGAQFDVSAEGTLVYLDAEGRLDSFPIVWVERDGTTQTLWADEGAYVNPRLSPDGSKLALTVLRDDNWDLWVLDLERGVPIRLTFDESIESEQIWSPDGEYLIFSSNRDGGVDSLYRKRADGSGEIERLTEAEKDQLGQLLEPGRALRRFRRGRHAIRHLDPGSRDQKDHRAARNSCHRRLS